MPTGRATSHRLDLFSLPELSPLAQKAPPAGVLTELILSRLAAAHTATSANSLSKPQGEAGAPLSGRSHPGPGRSLHPAHGLLLGRNKTQERKGSGKALLSQKTSFQRRSLMRAITHVRPNSPPSSITMAVVKTVTPRKLASDVPTQGFPPNIFLSKGHITSTLLLASPESPTLLHRRGEGQGSQAFLGEDHPALGRGAVKQAHSGPFQPHPKHPHTILIRFMYGAVKQDFTGKNGSSAKDCNPLI